MQCRALHEGAVSSRNHVSWRRNRVSVKCQCPRYLTGALPCRRRSARPADRPARPAMNRLRRRVPPRQHFQADVPHEVNHLPKMAAMGPGLAAIFGNSGTFAMPSAPVRHCNVHPSGGAPVRPSARPERPAPRQDAPFRKGRMRRSGGVPDGSCPLPGTRSGRGCATHRFPLWRTSPKSGTRPRSIKVRRS